MNREKKGFLKIPIYIFLLILSIISIGINYKIGNGIELFDFILLTLIGMSQFYSVYFKNKGNTDLLRSSYFYMSALSIIVILINQFYSLGGNILSISIIILFIINNIRLFYQTKTVNTDEEYEVNISEKQNVDDEDRVLKMKKLFSREEAQKSIKYGTKSPYEALTSLPIDINAKYSINRYENLISITPLSCFKKNNGKLNVIILQNEEKDSIAKILAGILYNKKMITEPKYMVINMKTLIYQDPENAKLKMERIIRRSYDHLLFLTNMEEFDQYTYAKDVYNVMEDHFRKYEDKFIMAIDHDPVNMPKKLRSRFTTII